MTQSASDTLSKTLADLEWDRLSQAVAERCRGPLRARLEHLPIAGSREGTLVALAETAEAMHLASIGEPLRVDGAREVFPQLARLEKRGALDGPALRDLMSVLGVARALRLFLGRHRHVAPALHARCALDPTLDVLLDELESAIESDGSLSDRASPDIRRLRSDVANLRARLIAKLEEILVEKAAILSDAFYTERDGRYVVPVRRDAHETLPGIVHGTSASGHSVFVEPRALVPHGNHLKMAQAELDREIARVLQALSDLAAERLPSLMAAADAIDHADLRAAAARLGDELGARVLPLSDESDIDLKAARHPLLLLDGVAVVPNDLPLSSGRALVLSGPNAGGKTVALKTLGLAALMMRAGLPIPAADGSRCGFFSHVASDVGDDQNIHKNLSTFSAHVTRLVQMLDETQPGALLLMDELAGGTDPEEGSALACALVDTLCRRGGAVAVTTHYEALKAMAMRDERMLSAAVGFNVAEMRPTFEVTLGMPGASSALDVARRFGVPEVVIERARAVLPEQSRDFDQLVRGIQVLREETQRTLDGARERERAAEALQAKAEGKLEALMAADQRSVARATTKLFDELRDIRARIKEARKALREARDEQSLQALLRKTDEAQRATNDLATEAGAARGGASAAHDTAPPVQLGDVSIGATVHVARLGRSAVILEGPLKGKVRVAAGALKLWVDVGELGASAPDAEKAPAIAHEAPPAVSAPSMPTADNTLDLRGLRVDDALAMLEAFLDRMFGAGEATAYVLHGVGSGALRDAVRSELRQYTRYVRDFRPGERDEGGERLTVVRLQR
ncbi:MAG: Smr/MutS family protein [Polyangiales bacterium]|nr:Smr/MutS family protein [Myxococcales bacterium]MCB9658990.1 Smr/MutS family protein [Sandaracinaceae bacterium]